MRVTYLGGPLDGEQHDIPVENADDADTVIVDGHEADGWRYVRDGDLMHWERFEDGVS